MGGVQRHDLRKGGGVGFAVPIRRGETEELGGMGGIAIGTQELQHTMDAYAADIGARRAADGGFALRRLYQARGGEDARARRGGRRSDMQPFRQGGRQGDGLGGPGRAGGGVLQDSGAFLRGGGQRGHGLGDHVVPAGGCGGLGGEQVQLFLSAREGDVKQAVIFIEQGLLALLFRGGDGGFGLVGKGDGGGALGAAQHALAGGVGQPGGVDEHHYRGLEPLGAMHRHDAHMAAPALLLALHLAAGAGEPIGKGGDDRQLVGRHGK